MKPERGCLGKQQHPTHRAATAAMWSLIRQFGKKRIELNVYKCPLCGYFHVGHRTTLRRPRKRRSNYT